MNLVMVWNWQPSVLIGVALVAAAYLGVSGPWRARFTSAQRVSRRQTLWFLSGAAVILMALVSPLDELGDNYLFSAHMAQHVLLALIAPPLLLLGTPGWMLRPMLRSRMLARVARALTSPVVAFAVFNAVFMLWHVPTLYEAALNDERIHIVEHLCFIATGVLNWWPILSPLTELPRLAQPAQILYLFLESVPATILSALIAFAPTILYPTYRAAQLLGVNPMADQEIAGLVMWMPGGMIYLIALTVVFFAWLGREEHADRQQEVMPSVDS
jgi:cytochrome c oxidase assembly factor CtaG